MSKSVKVDRDLRHRNITRLITSDQKVELSGMEPIKVIFQIDKTRFLMATKLRTIERIADLRFFPQAAPRVGGSLKVEKGQIREVEYSTLRWILLFRTDSRQLQDLVSMVSNLKCQVGLRIT